MNQFKLLIPLAFICCSRFSYAQDLPKVIPPSPSTQQFMKYVDYPVGSFTGIPDINIPLYTISEGDLTVPITLSYHASGTKPGDPNGLVGMGWTMNGGGKIARTIVGRPDEGTQASTLYTADQLVAQSFDTRNANITWWSKNQDTEPDLFTYSFNNHSGRFILKRDGALTPLLLPYKPLKIVWAGDFDVTDEQGTKYYFTSGESVETAIGGAPTAWDLTRMTSAIDPSNSITFITGPGPNETTSSFSEQVIMDDVNDNNGITRGCWMDDFGVVAKPYSDILSYWDPEYDPSVVNSYSGYVTYEIDFRSGKVVFTQYPATSLLQKMAIYDNSNQLLKTIEFVYTIKDTKRYLLKEVNFFDNQHHFINHYLVDYNDGIMPDAQHCSTDYWGYYNGITTGAAGSLMPAWTVGRNQRLPYTLGTNTRQTDLNYMETFVLNKITYPTGGYSTYDYEANTGNLPILNYSGNKVGGLRVKTIAHYKAPDAMPEVRTYDYPEGTMDFRPGNIDDYSYSTLGIVPDLGFSGQTYGWTLFRRRYYSSEPLFNICPHGSPVIYQTVTEYVGNGLQNTGKNIYYYDYQPTQQTTYQGNGSGSSSGDPIIYKQYLVPFQDWISGTLTGKSTYKNVNGTYYSVSDVGYNYIDSLGESVRGLKFDRFIEYNFDGCTSQPNWILPDNYDPYAINYAISGYNYGDYYIQSGFRRLASTSETQYGALGLHPITTTTSNEYGNSEHGQVTKKTVNTSMGDNIVTTYKYPADFVTTSPYDQMHDTDHKWSSVIQQDEYKNSNFLNSLKTDYALYNGIALPSTVSTKKGGATYESRMQFLGYDTKANIQSVSKTGGAKINYVFSYNGEYPIAQITNADYSTVLSVLGGQASVDSFRDNLNPTDAAVNSFLAPLRNSTNLPGAQVVTYTYKPLVGMTSATDPKGQTTYYEYDSFQRLKTIRDQDRHILKSYCYNYAGQPTDCSVPATANIYVRIEISNQTSSGYHGGTLTKGDVYLKVYSDAACTSPLTLNNDLDVVVAEDATTTYTYDPPSGETSNVTFTVASGTSSLYLGKESLDYIANLTSPVYGPETGETIYTYDVAANGILYFPTTTYSY